MLLLHEKDVSVFSGVKKGCRAIGTNEGHNVVKHFLKDTEGSHLMRLLGPGKSRISQKSHWQNFYFM